MLMSTVLRNCQNRSMLTGVSTPSRNCIVLKTRNATAVPAAPAPSGSSVACGSRTVSRRRPAKWPTITSASDDTPSVWSSAKSKKSPIENPVTAPATGPASSPAEITMRGTRSGEAPNSDSCESAEVWTITATAARIASRIESWVVSAVTRRAP